MQIAMPVIDEHTNLSQIAVLVKSRVRQLLIVYALLILGSILMFLLVLAGVAGICYAMYLSGNIYGRAIVLLIAVIAIACICLKIVLEPMFKVFEPRVKKGVEIKKKDYPELFQIIEEIVKEAGCQIPKHVFISNECNAYVYYPTLWGNLFHGRQNLTVGLPLLMTLNKTEFKAILSHEFGHFTQKSVSINRIANLSEYICGAISRSLDRIENADDDSYEAKAQFFVKIATKIMMKQYTKVAPLNGILSRAQEFDADSFSYRIAGTEGAISSLCKISYFDETWRKSMNYLAYCMKEPKRIPESIKVMINIFLSGCKDRTGILLSPSEHLGKPVPVFASRLSFVNDDTHPSMTDRCNAIRALPVVHTEWDNAPALDYFSASMVDKVFNTIVSDYQKELYSGSTVLFKKDISDEEIKGVVAELSPVELNAFYQRNLFFNSETYIGPGEKHLEYESFPFTKQNAEILQEFSVAGDDLDVLNRIVDENSPSRSFYYKSKQYTGTNVPLAEHKSYYSPLADKAIDIIKHCNYWMSRKADSDDTLGGHFNLFYLAGLTQVSLNEINEEVNTVKLIAQKHDTSTKAVEYVNSTERLLRQIAAPMMEENTEGQNRFIMIAKWMDVHDDLIEQVVSFFRSPARGFDAQVSEVTSIFYHIISDYRERAWDVMKEAWIIPVIKESR